MLAITYATTATKSATVVVMVQVQTTAHSANTFAMDHTVYENVHFPNTITTENAIFVMKIVLAVVLGPKTNLGLVDVIHVKRQLLACMTQT